MCLRPFVALLAWLPLACKSAAHRVEIPFATVQADTAELATTFASRISRLREEVLAILPHASELSSYTVRVLDPDAYADVRLNSHAAGQIFKNPFLGRSSITVPADAPDAVLAHELVHAHRAAFWRPLTRFMEEGLAEYIAEELDASVTYFADAVVFLGFHYEVATSDSHTLLYRNSTGQYNSQFSRYRPAQLPLTRNPIDPFVVLAAPRAFLDTPFEARTMLLRYTLARVVMQRAILHNEEAPFSDLAALCEEARDTRAGVLDVTEVLKLAGFFDIESLRRYIADQFEQAWLESNFSSSEILGLILKIETEYDRQFSSPLQFLEQTGLRYLRGNYVSQEPDPDAEDYPGFPEHFAQHWPSTETLRDARRELQPATP